MNEVQKELNDHLMHILDNLHKMEEKALITKQFKDISLTDMHSIQAIGYDSSRNMSSVAKDLGITVGTLTTAVNNLVKKDYVKRVRSPKDRRVVLISLTPKGQKAYKHHEKFHEALMSKLAEAADEKEMTLLINLLKGIKNYFDRENQAE